MVQYLPSLAACLSVAIIGSDLYARRVPNGWLLAALVLGVVLMAMDWIRGAGGPWSWSALSGFAIGLVTMLPLYMFGWMGAGDVKLSIAMGLLGGLQVLLVTMVLAGIIGGVLALWLLATRRSRLGTRQRSVPFGSALGIGFVTAIWALPVLY